MSILKYKYIILRARTPLSIIMRSARVLTQIIIILFDVELIIRIGTFWVELEVICCNWCVIRIVILEYTGNVIDPYSDNK